MTRPPGWVGVDLDGTLAFHEPGFFQMNYIGDPIPRMLAQVKAWIEEGVVVKLFTARMSASKTEQAVFLHAWHKWCLKWGLPPLEATCVKDFNMLELYDDRAVQIEINTGRMVGHSTRGLFNR